jgi:apolipoprotein D and lipocalin family protein
MIPLRLTLAPLLVGLALFTAGCRTTSPSVKPLPLVPNVDLPRFMGDWYVIANIPTFIERDAWNAVESYALNPDGSIATTFRFNRGGPDGPLKTYNPTGFIHDPVTRAEWRMQFLWPFKSAYLILHLDPDYQTTIIGVPSRKYVWIMARTPTLPEPQYQDLVRFLESVDYDVSLLQKVPQQTIP